MSVPHVASQKKRSHVPTPQNIKKNILGSVKEDNAARKRVTRSVTAQVVVQQKRTVQDAVRKTQDAVRKRVTRLARSFNPNPNPDRSVRLQLKRRVWQEGRSVRLQLKSNIPAKLLANEGRVRSRLRLQRNRSELCKTQCSRRATQIKTSVRAF